MARSRLFPVFDRRSYRRRFRPFSRAIRYTWIVYVRALAPWMIAFMVVPVGCAFGENDWTEPIPSYVIDLFEPREFMYSGGKYVNERFPYRLFRPQRLENHVKYPIIVWTAGYGEAGNDNVGQLMHLDHLLSDRQHLEKYKFFILAMQNPPAYAGWVLRAGPPLGDEPATIQMAILNHLVKSEPIDDKRVYLTGISDGGSACWEMAMRYPSRFAAIAPMASNGTKSPDARLIHLIGPPIWAFHCNRDPSTSPDAVRQTVARLQRLGANVALTEIHSMSHDCWSAAFRDYGLGDWLLSHRLGIKGGYPPGVRPWRWWHVMPLPAITGGIILVWVVERKRRMTKPNKSNNTID
jgi:predicted esterase